MSLLDDVLNSEFLMSLLQCSHPIFLVGLVFSLELRLLAWSVTLVRMSNHPNLCGTEEFPRTYRTKMRESPVGYPNLRPPTGLRKGFL